MSGPVQPPLTVETVDGTTSGRPITKIKVTNGTLAVSGSTATLTISGGGGGSGTVTSVGLTETGTALTITGSPVTTSGTINIAGAGTSSQVILGDLTLGTLTSGTVTGTGSANQVSYWTSTTAQAGSTGLTYDPSTGDLTVGGYVETGTKVTTPSGTSLTLDTNNGTASGSIVIANGANGQISITPNGTGTIKLDGVEIDNSAIATGYVLKATSTTAAGWAAESGGGGVTFPLEGSDGTAALPTYSFSADTNTGIYRPTADEIGFTVGGNERMRIVNNAIEGITFRVDGTDTAAAPGFSFDPDNDTGMFSVSPNTLSFSTGASERLRIGSSGEILIGGTAAGASGEVLTSGGSGAPVSWAAAGGGSSNDFSKILPQVGSMSAANQYNISTAPPWGGGQIVTQAISSMALGARPYAFPFIAPETGSVTAVGIVITTAETSVDLYVGIYENDSNNLPSTRLGYATIDMSSTGTIYSTSLTGTISLTVGEQYWYSISASANVFNGVLDAVSTQTGSYAATPLGLTDDINTLNYSIKDTTVSANAVPPSTYSTDDLDGSANRVVVGLKF